MTNTFNSYVLNKDDAIKFYKENYGIDVIIDSVEINTEADEVPDFDIEEFSNNYELYYGSNYGFAISVQEELYTCFTIRIPDALEENKA